MAYFGSTDKPSPFASSVAKRRALPTLVSKKPVPSRAAGKQPARQLSNSKTASGGDKDDDLIYIETRPVQKNLKRRAESSEANNCNVETPPQKRPNRMGTPPAQDVAALELLRLKLLWAEQDAAKKTGTSRSPLIQLGDEKPWSWSDVHSQPAKPAMVNTTEPTINKKPACEPLSSMVQLRGERPWSWDSIPEDKRPRFGANSTNQKNTTFTKSPAAVQLRDASPEVKRPMPVASPAITKKTTPASPSAMGQPLDGSSPIQKKPTNTSPPAIMKLRDERPWSWHEIPKNKRPMFGKPSTTQTKPTPAPPSAMFPRRDERPRSSEMTGTKNTTRDAAKADGAGHI
ncbi:hypothetical protein F4808DRAFT_476438 [Astrocystis sublimbata]|nr:hypothetical protein F4808DRAFT_476438 [Astrocystis sublimbata]